jgi:hypothetical protein
LPGSKGVGAPSEKIICFTYDVGGPSEKINLSTYGVGGPSENENRLSPLYFSVDNLMGLPTRFVIEPFYARTHIPKQRKKQRIRL